jgi:CheY-like chemotaxis protein
MTAPARRPSAETVFPCQTVNDLWTPQGRAAIGLFVAPFLLDTAASPLELLHAAPLQQAFEAHALRKTVCERVARIQAAPGGQDEADHRRLVLEDLIRQAAALTLQRLKQVSPTAVAAEGYPTAVAALTARTPAEAATFAVNATVARSLATCRDRAAKIDLLLSFSEAAAADGPADDDPALAHADAFLGEHLAVPGVLRGLAASAATLNDFLALVLDLHDGRPLNPDSLTRPLARLSALLAGHPMPGCRSGLEAALQDALQGTERLIPAVAGDILGQKTLLADLMATADLVRRVKRPDGFLGGPATHDAIDRRVALMVSADKLQECLRGLSLPEKLRDLFHLQATLAGSMSTKSIDDYILMLMDGRDFVGRLYDAVEGAEPRLRILAELQAAVLASPFPKERRKALAKGLDTAQHDLLKTTTILTALRKTGRPPIDAVLSVADLAASGAFTRGRCLAEARELIRRHTRHRDFVRQYLKTLRPEGSGTPPDQAQADLLGARLSQLATRIRNAGVDFTDLSELRVLIAEDEESARDYIAMVLRDMGVVNVITAHDGRHALKVFQDFEDGIDLIICDWKMPRMSGLDFLKQVRSVRPKLPFLMVTALATMENVEEAKQHDVTAYIAKPFPPEQLEEKVLLLVNQAAPSQAGPKPP